MAPGQAPTTSIDTPFTFTVTSGNNVYTTETYYDPAWEPCFGTYQCIVDDAAYTSYMSTSIFGPASMPVPVPAQTSAPPTSSPPISSLEITILGLPVSTAPSTGASTTSEALTLSGSGDRITTAFGTQSSTLTSAGSLMSADSTSTPATTTGNSIHDAPAKSSQLPLSRGTVVGISIGSSLGGLLLISLIFAFLLRRRRRPEKPIITNYSSFGIDDAGKAELHSEPMASVPEKSALEGGALSGKIVTEDNEEKKKEHKSTLAELSARVSIGPGVFELG